MSFGGAVLFGYAGRFVGDRAVDRHGHPGAELVYLVRGECLTRFDDGGVFHAHPGSILMAPPGAMHTQSSPNGECETLYAVMELPEGRFDTATRLIDAAGDPFFGGWFETLYQLGEAGETGQAALLAELVWTRIAALESRRESRRDRHPALTRAEEFLERHLGDAFSIPELARRAGVSRSHLDTLFRREFGSGILEYRTELRMRRARQLLQNPYLSIGEVAEAAGFADANYFIRVFRRRHAATPGSYRRNLRHMS